MRGCTTALPAGTQELRPDGGHRPARVEPLVTSGNAGDPSTVVRPTVATRTPKVVGDVVADVDTDSTACHYQPMIVL
jgi:hypothetical protein